MRQRQFRRVHDPVIEQKQVEVEASRPVGQIAAPIPPVAALDAKQKIEQVFRLQLRLQRDRRVHKRRLIREADGLGAVKRRAPLHLPGLAQILHGRQQRPLWQPGG